MSASWAFGIACFLCAGNLAYGQAGKENISESRVIYTAALMQNCTQVDELLRKTCARFGSQLSDTYRKYCDLPAESFEVRTARPYRALKEAFRTEFKAHEPKAAAALQTARESFEQQFAQVRAGKVSMIDFESLGREMRDRCSVVEREWLSLTPRQK